MKRPIGVTLLTVAAVLAGLAQLYMRVRGLNL